jgi:hypothetical protein
MASAKNAAEAALKVTAKPTCVQAIKGFDKDLSCQGFVFKIGDTFKHEGPVVACKDGFHAITDHPLQVFQYYPPAGSRFCRVELSGEMHSDDSIKTAAEILTVGKELGLRDLTLEAVKWVMDRAIPDGQVAVKKNGLATASGDQGAATASGYQGAATASGDQGAATASGTQGAATASGTQGAATASGYQGAATASGYLGIVSGVDGNALFAVERGIWNGSILSVACGIVGQDGIVSGVQYRCKGGKLVEAI